MGLVESVLELGGMEAHLKVCCVLLGKSHRDFMFPALLKEIDLEVQTLLGAVIYYMGFHQDHFSSDAHRCVAVLNGNVNIGRNLSFPTFPQPGGKHDQNFYFIHQCKIKGTATLD